MDSVHPRAYGEHISPKKRGFHGFGSSPCIRGTCGVWRRWVRLRRFIPVHTGNMLGCLETYRVYTVHPRAYGEHCCGVRRSPLTAGSSPCIRGTFCYSSSLHSVVRFIPVHTGNINNLVYDAYGDAVHPRAYGEHTIYTQNRLKSIGSSPCIRGTSSLESSIRSTSRFIPVHTGNIAVSPVTPAINTVHPRAYGEHLLMEYLFMDHIGSSPCIRGTSVIVFYPVKPYRFIPVHTGNI